MPSRTPRATRVPPTRSCSRPRPARSSPSSPTPSGCCASRTSCATGFNKLGHIGKAVSIFGSARTPPDDPRYREARELARRLGHEGFAIITGGGPGIMEAANRGARDAGVPSVGLGIELPHEQGMNEYVDLALNFHYFFTRKVMFVRYASGFVVFPGGFGTMDELFEAATLRQTEKIRYFPIVLVGTSYWGGLVLVPARPDARRGLHLARGHRDAGGLRRPRARDRDRRGRRAPAAAAGRLRLRGGGQLRLGRGASPPASRGGLHLGVLCRPKRAQRSAGPDCVRYANPIRPRSAARAHSHLPTQRSGSPRAAPAATPQARPRARYPNRYSSFSRTHSPSLAAERQGLAAALALDVEDGVVLVGARAVEHLDSSSVGGLGAPLLGVDPPRGGLERRRGPSRGRRPRPRRGRGWPARAGAGTAPPCAAWHHARGRTSRPRRGRRGRPGR